MRISMKAMVSVVLAVTIVACGGGGGGSTGTGGASACMPGETRACTGPGACQGGQACASDGSWGPCDCGTGGSAPSSSSSSGSSSSGTGPCTPKTCLTIAVELAGTTNPPPEACGIFDDGCGNQVGCPTSQQCTDQGCTCSSPFQSCGGTAPRDDSYWVGSGQGGTPQLCGGGCTVLVPGVHTTQWTDECEFNFNNAKAVMCTAAATVKPPASFGTCSLNPETYPGAATMWCCK